MDEGDDDDDDDYEEVPILQMSDNQMAEESVVQVEESRLQQQQQQQQQAAETFTSSAALESAPSAYRDLTSSERMTLGMQVLAHPAHQRSFSINIDTVLPHSVEGNAWCHGHVDLCGERVFFRTDLHSMPLFALRCRSRTPPRRSVLRHSSVTSIESSPGQPGAAASANIPAEVSDSLT